MSDDVNIIFIMICTFRPCFRPQQQQKNYLKTNFEIFLNNDVHFLRLCCASKFISGTRGNKRDIAELYVIASSCIFFSCWLLIMHLPYLYTIPLEVSETKKYILQNCASFFKDRYIVQSKLTKIYCGLHIFHGSAINI